MYIYIIYIDLCPRKCLKKWIPSSRLEKSCWVSLTYSLFLRCWGKNISTSGVDQQFARNLPIACSVEPLDYPFSQLFPTTWNRDFQRVVRWRVPPISSGIFSRDVSMAPSVAGLGSKIFMAFKAYHGQNGGNDIQNQNHQSHGGFQILKDFKVFWNILRYPDKKTENCVTQQGIVRWFLRPKIFTPTFASAPAARRCHFFPRQTHRAGDRRQRLRVARRRRRAVPKTMTLYSKTSGTRNQWWVQGQLKRLQRC